MCYSISLISIYDHIHRLKKQQTSTIHKMVRPLMRWNPLMCVHMVIIAIYYSDYNDLHDKTSIILPVWFY